MKGATLADKLDRDLEHTLARGKRIAPARKGEFTRLLELSDVSVRIRRDHRFQKNLTSKAALPGPRSNLLHIRTQCIAAMRFTGRLCLQL